MKRDNKNIFLVPLYIVCFVPLVMWGRILKLNLSQYAWFPNREEGMDFFLASKQAVLCSAVLLMIILMGNMAVKKTILGVWKQNTKKLWMFIPLGIYIAMSIVSTCCSDYRTFGFAGCMDNYESIWVVAGYGVTAVYGWTAIDSAKNPEWAREHILTVLAVVLGIVGLTGTLQTFGFDPLCTKAVSALVLHGRLAGMQITSIAEKAYATLYNPNYLGVMGVMTIPLLLAKALSAKTQLRKAVYAVPCVLMTVAFWGSGSKTGRVMLGVCLFVFLLIYTKKIWFKAVCLGAGLIGLAAVAVFLAGISGKFEQKRNTVIQSICTNENNVELKCHDKEIVMAIDIYGSSMPEIVTVCDSEGIPYQMECDKDDVLHFADNLFPELTVTAVQYENYISIDLREEKQDGNIRHWYFTNQTQDGTYQYVTVFGKTERIDSSEVRIFSPMQGRESSISGRGYIWSRSIPLLADYLVLGSGQDSFTLIFPNQDYLGKAAYDFENVLISRAHSLYLQIGIQSGGIALVAYIIFFAMLLVRLCKKRDNPLAAALFASILGYFLMGLTNDSSVTTTPIFFLLTALGLSLR